MRVSLLLSLAALVLSCAATTQPIAQWLASINPTLKQYAAGMSEYGYENSDTLGTAEELDECFDELGIKKPHRRLIRKQFDADRETCDTEAKSTTSSPKPDSSGFESKVKIPNEKRSKSIQLLTYLYLSPSTLGTKPSSTSLKLMKCQPGPHGSHNRPTIRTSSLMRL
jgi:hypothetical protein